MRAGGQGRLFGVTAEPYADVRQGTRRATAAVLFAVLVGNAAGILWIWYQGGNVTDVDDSAELVTSVARLTGLFAAYLALIEVILLARIGRDKHPDHTVG